MNKRVGKFMLMAVKLARQMEKYKTNYFFCGILAKGNHIINFGFNRPYKTHPRAKNQYKKIHCELDAILGISKNEIYNSTLYLARVGYDNRAHLMMSKPCPHCQALLKHAGVKQVYFTINDSMIGKWNIRNNEWNAIKNNTST